MLKLGDTVSVRIRVGHGYYWQDGIIDKVSVVNGMYRVRFDIAIGGREGTHGWYRKRDLKEH